MDLSGGYYDAGDNVKFNFPMAFTTTMLAWSAMEFAKRMGDQLDNTREAIRWSTDYLIKSATQTKGRIYVGVGDGNADHSCWERPEDMDTPRTVYSISANSPGSDVAAEIAAALASASILFRKVDPVYSVKLLGVAADVMQFAMDHQGKYSDSIGCNYYCSYSGYKDELLWGAAWMFRATNNATYAKFLNSLDANDATDIFSWDNKFAGARVLLARKSLVDNIDSFNSFRTQAEEFICKIHPNSPSSTTKYTTGGLMFKLSHANLQYVTSISFLLFTYAKYMAHAKTSFECGSGVVMTQTTLRSLAKTQVDYILGRNPLKMSYMVGYGEKYPMKIHHRGSSLPSISIHPENINCQGGFQYYESGEVNPNILTGAVVGGPNENDAFADDRKNYAHSEPATYINAPLVGCLAYLVSSPGQ